MNKLFSLPLSGALAAALLAAPLTVPVHAAPDGANVVINEAYTNGGSANAVYTHSSSSSTTPRSSRWTSPAGPCSTAPRPAP